MSACGYQRSGQEIREFSQEEYEEKVGNYLSEAISEDDDNAVLYFKKAKSEYATSNTKEALNTINVAVDLNDQDFRFYLLRAKIRFDLEQLEKAKQDGERAQELGCEYVELYVLLVNICLQLDDHIAADSYLKRLRYLDAQHVQLNYLTGLNYYYISDTVNAVSYLNKAKEDLPNQVEIYALLTEIAVNQNRLSDAETYLKIGLEKNKESKQLKLAWSDLKEKQGDKEGQKSLLLQVYKEDEGEYEAALRLSEWYLGDRKYDSTLFYVAKAKPFNAEDVYRGNRLIADAYFYKRSNDSAEKYYDVCLSVNKLDKYAKKQRSIVRWRIREKNKPKESSSENISNFVEINPAGVDSTKQEEKKGLFDLW